MPLPILYKKLLALVVVLGPMFWLMLTEDGRRRTDVLMLWFFGEPQINVSLVDLGNAISEQDLRQVFPQLKLVCEERESRFGKRSCKAPISAINQIPAYFIAFFLTDNRLMAMKAGYRSRYQDSMYSMLRALLGPPTGNTPPGSAWSWSTPHGFALMPRQAVEVKEESTLVWLSSELMQ